MTADAIQLPEAPGIPGLRFRHFRAGRDYYHMAAITRLSAEADGTERADTPDELEAFYADLTNCDPYTDMIFAEVDPGDGREAEVIGYSRGMWQVETTGEHRYVFFGRIVPAWRRRRGLARALIARSLRVQKEAGMTESALGVDSENLSGQRGCMKIAGSGS